MPSAQSLSRNSRQERELAHWKEWETKADAVWGWQTPAGRTRAARRAKLFREHGRMDRNSVVLEIGCGTGEFTVRVAPHVGQLCATDLTPELLARAKARAGPECSNVEFQIQDAMALRLPDDEFDAVFGCSILHHLDAARALREVRRVLVPGGWCVFSEPNMLNPQIALQKNIGFLKRGVGDSPDESAFFKGQMQRMLNAAGFAEVRVQPFDFVHPLIPPRWIGAAERIGLSAEKIPVLRAFSGSLLISGRKPMLHPGT